MIYKTFTAPFICDVCGLATADFITLNTKYWDEQMETSLETGKHWRVDYVDHRHSACEVTHGSFKEMVEQYQRELKVSAQEAEDFVKTNRKRGDFDKKVEKILKDKEKMV